MQPITLLEKVYNTAYHTNRDSYGARLVEAIRDYKFSNGQPLNIIKAMVILDAVSTLKGLGHCNTNQYNQVLKNLVSLSGYSKEELLHKLDTMFGGLNNIKYELQD